MVASPSGISLVKPPLLLSPSATNASWREPRVVAVSLAIYHQVKPPSQSALIPVLGNVSIRRPGLFGAKGSLRGGCFLVFYGKLCGYILGWEETDVWQNPNKLKSCLFLFCNQQGEKPHSK